MLSRSLLLSIALVALAARSALVGCGGGGAQVALAVSRSGELVDVVRSTLRARQSERQRGAGGAVGLAPASTVAQDSSTAAAPTRSTTLTQEEGVGESDLLLGDDTRLFTLQPGATRAEASVGASRRNADGSLTTLPNLVLTADVAATENGTAELQIDGLHASTDLQGLVATSQQWIATGNPCQGVVDCVGTPFPGAVWLRSQLALLTSP